MSFAEDSDDES